MPDPYGAYRQHVVPYGTGSNTPRMQWLQNAPQFQGHGPLMPGSVQRETKLLPTPGQSRWNQYAPKPITPKSGQGGASGGVSPLATGTLNNSMGSLNLNTSITPQPLYSPELTQAGVNQVRAEADQAANLPWLMKQHDSPGVSRSAGTLGLVAPKAGAIAAGGQENAANLILDDSIANQKNMLAGEIARGAEARGMGGLWASLQDMLSQFGQNQFRRQLGLFDMMG